MKENDMVRNIRLKLIALLLSLIMLLSMLCGCSQNIRLDEIPEYCGAAYVEINGNLPFFTDDDITDVAFERYSPLDALGRCGVAFACIGTELMPTEERGEIASITPAGWEYKGVSNNNEYAFIEGGYVYNRCHLVGFQLAGENDNEQNLITGTRYLNIEGMLPFENMVADYVEKSENHVMYRVTPIYDGLDYIPQGVLMEAYSVEDSGLGICFCIFAYNVQPGVSIDYFTGVNVGDGSILPDVDGNRGDGSGESNGDQVIVLYIISINSNKFHLSNSSCVERIKEENRKEFNCTRDEMIENDYVPCKICNP